MQRKVSALQRGVSYPTTSNHANSGGTTKLGYNDQREAGDLVELRERSTLWNLAQVSSILFKCIVSSAGVLADV